MSATMRAKFQVHAVEPQGTAEVLKLGAVCGPGGFGPNGESEDNTYARYTPSGALTMTITNPSLVGAFKPGQKFYLDFTEAAE